MAALLFVIIGYSNSYKNNITKIGQVKVEPG
jgi:hypothetical protein